MTEHSIPHSDLLAAISQHESSGHSVFAPSSSAMWLWCSGSLLANLAAKDEAGEEAAEGTVAHGIAEHWLKTGERPDHIIGLSELITEGDQVFEIMITKSMLDYVEEYVDWCVNLPGDHRVEQRVFFSEYTPLKNQGGTADHQAFEPGVLTITDLKYGQGVAVYAAADPSDPRAVIWKDDGDFELNGNPQGLLYALGSFLEWDWLYSFQRIVIRIAQPRRDQFDVWETTREELLAFADFVKVRAAAAWVPGAPRRPSEKACRWCNVKAGCPAYLKVLEDLADDAFDVVGGEVTPADTEDIMDALGAGLFDPKLTTPTELTTEHMAKAIAFRGMFDAWFNAIEAELERRALDGVKVPGKKLVESRSNRVFASQPEAIKRLGEAGVSWVELFDLKFISPAQAEDLLKDQAGMKKKDAVEFLEPVVRKPPGKPTLVSIADKRPEYVHPADDAFDDVFDDEDEL
jgi:hypothetical protein